MNKTKTYYISWRSKWLCAGADSIDDMIKSYQDNIKILKEYKKTGLEFRGNPGDDYIEFTTEDPKLAKKFGMEEMEECE